MIPEIQRVSRVSNQVNEKANIIDAMYTPLNKQNSAPISLYASLLPYPPLSGRENGEWEFSEWR